MPLVFDTEQNFTCRSCGECCRRAFDIVVTEAEKQRYESADAARWFRETGAARTGRRLIAFRVRERGPFSHPEAIRWRLWLSLRGEPLPDPRGARRKRQAAHLPDVPVLVRRGLGRDARPFQLLLSDGGPKRWLSPAGPTGASSDLWSRGGERPRSPTDRPLQWVRGVRIDSELLESMRWILRRLLDLHEPDFSLRRNLRRIAVLVEDWTRQRVLKLGADEVRGIRQAHGGVRGCETHRPRTGEPGGRPFPLPRLLLRVAGSLGLPRPGDIGPRSQAPASWPAPSCSRPVAFFRRTRLRGGAAQLDRHRFRAVLHARVPRPEGGH